MKPSDLGFDVYAMANPKSKADLLVLAKEAIAELKEIQQHLEQAIRLARAAKERNP